MDDNYPVMLSICVPTYNHEKYIRQALESIFMQKTNYSYEILVGEDKSTDNTRKVLEEIERENHPELKIFYRQHNMNNSDCRNLLDLMDKSRGKYLIILEGDDYWIDDNKIECQIRFLEDNPNYIAVAHNCIVVDANSKIIDENYDECHDDDYTWEHYASEILPGQTATVMMRNLNKLSYVDMSLIRTRRMPGDRKINFTLLCYGKVFCIQKKMSAYRHVTLGGDSWSANYRYDYEDSKNWHLEVIDYAKSICITKANIIADYMLYAAIRQAFVVHKCLTLRQYFHELKNVKHFWKCTYIFIIRDFRRYVLKKKIYFPNLKFKEGDDIH